MTQTRLRGIWNVNEDIKNFVIQEALKQEKDNLKNKKNKMNWMVLSGEVKKNYPEFHKNYLEGSRVSAKLKPLWLKYKKAENKREVALSIESPRTIEIKSENNENNENNEKEVLFSQLKEKTEELQEAEENLAIMMIKRRDLQDHLKKVTEINKDIMSSNLQMESELYSLRTEISDLSHFHEREKIKIIECYNNGYYEDDYYDIPKKPLKWIGVLVLFAGVLIVSPLHLSKYVFVKN